MLILMLSIQLLLCQCAAILCVAIQAAYMCRLISREVTIGVRNIQKILWVRCSGTGKTVQVIAMIGYFVEVRRERGPFLVAAPSSVLPNWDNEFQR